MALAIVAIRAEFVLNRDVSLFFLVADRQESTRDWCVSSQSCTVVKKMNNPYICSHTSDQTSVKSRLREGSEVSRDSRTGDVLAEILVKGSGSDNMIPVLASFVSPWSLAEGTVFDVECRNPSTGDGAFLAVTPVTGGKSLIDLKDSFFVNALTGPTGRFSFYGPPTDIKVKQSNTNGNYRTIDMSFSTLSQSTQTEIPRLARIVATIPEGTQQAVLLVASASASRWRKGADGTIATVAESFRAVPAPTSALRMRTKERRTG